MQVNTCNVCIITGFEKKINAFRNILKLPLYQCLQVDSCNTAEYNIDIRKSSLRKYPVIGGKMKIQYLGHSCFRLISDLGTAVICDPYNGEMVGFDMPKLSCDLVTISHSHADHAAVDEVKGNPPVLEKEVALAADDVAVESLHTFHDDKKGKQRGDNYVFCFLVDGLKIVHLGDVGCLDEKLAAKIHGCDVLLLPIGGIFTVDAHGAKWYVDKVQPKIVIPMHYKTAEHSFNIGTLDEFLKLFPSEQVTFVKSETLTLVDEPQNSAPQITVLERYED